MRYLPLSDTDRTEMLATIGAANVDELFRDAPEEARRPDPAEEPEAEAEAEPSEKEPTPEPKRPTRGRPPKKTNGVAAASPEAPKRKAGRVAKNATPAKNSTPAKAAKGVKATPKAKAKTPAKEKEKEATPNGTSAVRRSGRTRG